MFNRKKLARERLEAYLVYLLLRARPLIAMSGVALLVYSLAIALRYFSFSCVLFVLAVYLLLLSSSFQFVLLTARWAAWLATLGTKE